MRRLGKPYLRFLVFRISPREHRDVAGPSRLHMAKTSSRRVTARVFTTGRSQAVRLPKEFRFDTDTVLVHREGNAVILEPSREWPVGYVESFTGVPDDFARPTQGRPEKRRKL